MLCVGGPPTGIRLYGKEPPAYSITDDCHGGHFDKKMPVDTDATNV